MCLFLEVHELDGRDAEAFAHAGSPLTPMDVRLLKHWPADDGRTVALLMEAPDDATLRACTVGAKKITELFRSGRALDVARLDRGGVMSAVAIQGCERPGLAVPFRTEAQA